MAYFRKPVRDNGRLAEKLAGLHSVALLTVVAHQFVTFVAESAPQAADLGARKDASLAKR
jgi:hypothetical protein